MQNYRANHDAFTKTKNKETDSKQKLSYRGNFNIPFIEKIKFSDKKRK